MFVFGLWNCLWTLNPYRLVAQKVFLFQTLGEISIFTLPGKVPPWQKCQNDVLNGNLNMDVSPYMLKFKLFFKNTCSKMTAWTWSIVVKKWNDIPSQKGFSNYCSNKHNTYSAISISNTNIIMKILKHELLILILHS